MVFFLKFPQILVVVSKFLRFSTNSEVKTKKKREKKRSSSQKFNEIRCNSTKITKKQFLLTNSRAVNTNLGVLGLDLHSSNTSTLISSGHSPRLGGTIFVWEAQAVIGGHGPGMPPSPWRRARVVFEKLCKNNLGYQCKCYCQMARQCFLLSHRVKCT